MKILFVSTISSTINAFMIPHIEQLLDQMHLVDVACNIDRDISPRLIHRGCRVFNLEFQRSPLKKENYFAFKNLKKLIHDKKYDVVHTHTPNASACVRLACRKMEKVKVLYTAHGFHFFIGAPLINWLVFYPIERWLSRYTNVLITINKEDYTRAKKSFKAGRVEFIPGVGLNTHKLSGVVVDKLEKRYELGIPVNAVVVLSVGELNKNKNHETVIKAIAKLDNPQIIYMICGQGSLKYHLRELAISLGITEQVKLLGYRTDVSEIYKIADVFALPSFREGLSLALMESMAAGLPVVCSDIRGNRDLIEDGIGGFLVKPDDVKGFATSLKSCIENIGISKSMGLHNIVAIKQYDSAKVKAKLGRVYSNLV